MKLLVLGIDGLGEESLSKMKLNRLAGLISKGKKANPSVDNIVSRGWPEIYSGATAYETGAFFQIPHLLKNKICPTQKTGANVVSNHIGEDELLWSRLRKLGYRVGLFGLPTVTTSQTTCEFSFPATGAGQFKNSTNSNGVYPADLASLADYSKSNSGLRIGQGAFLPKSSDELARWLRDHLSQYFYTLRQTLRRNDVNALILGTRFVTLFYKFRHILSSELTDPEDINLKKVLLDAAEEFDYELVKFIEEANPEELFIVSDHGLGELRYHVTINEVLRELGCINYKPLVSRAAKQAARKVRDIYKGRKANYYPDFDYDNSSAFSIGYTDVIYINDARFKGPEMSDESRYERAVKLSKELTSYVATQGYDQFVAFEPIKSSGWTDPIETNADPIPLPDIRCVLAEGCVNLQRTNGNVVEKNEPYYAEEMYKKGFFAEHSGCKTNDTIAAYIGSDRQPFKPQSLTDLYIEILRVAGSTS
ncbi:alkaline phosphatase family protein [Neptuniibacter sp. QD57_21]|uniref:alkaline phosphatase family protein n=1 Tax=Neptuniibacter sp. QD57_21 TaxID=3398213 RepID=UPI0039F5172A